MESALRVSKDVLYPFAVGGLNIMGLLDSGADYLMVDPVIWEEMKGQRT